MSQLEQTSGQYRSLRLSAIGRDLIELVIHHSNIFMLGGESYRLKQKTSC